MAEWKQENGVLFKEHDFNKGLSGCVQYLFIPFGLLFFAIGTGVIIFAESFSTRGIGSFFALMGFISVASIIRNLQQKRFLRIALDSAARTLSVSTDKEGTSPYQAGFDQISHYMTEKFTIHNSNQRTSRTAYRVLLVQKNGAVIEADLYQNRDSAVSTAKELAAFTGHPYEGDSEDSGLPDSQSSESGFSGIASGSSKSENVIESSENGRIKIQLKQPKKSLFDKILIVVIFFAFLAAPAFILTVFYTELSDSPGFVQIILAVFLGSFSFFFYGIVFLVALGMIRKYELIFDNGILEARLRFPKILKFFNTEQKLPAANMQSALIHFISDHSGATHQFQLAIRMKEGVRIRPEKAMMFGLGLFSGKTSLQSFPEGKGKAGVQFLPLWQSPFLNPKKGPTAHDLKYIAGRINSHYRLNQN